MFLLVQDMLQVVTFWAATASGIWVISLTTLAIYRLFLGPLAKFPGPKPAALSKWYEGYYEIVCNGKFSREIDRMHDVYGPIVRVAPNELHIRDSHFFNEVYMKKKSNKHGWDTKFGSKHSTFTTEDGGLHRRRRVALSPMFSRRAILGFVPVIREKVDLLCKRMTEFEQMKKPINVTEAFPAFTGDVIMDYAFGFSYKHLESPHFESFHEAFIGVGNAGHLFTQFPLLFPLLDSLPDFIVTYLKPSLASVYRLKRDQWDLVARTLRGETTKQSSHHTIFNEILHSKLPPEDKTQQRLTDEAQIVVGAGVETTAYALCVGTFHIVATPRIYQTLHEELVLAFPDSSITPEFLELEKLPYLKACIQEALRLSYGLSARNPRTYEVDMRYREWNIPKGTVVGMTNVDVHHDEDIFPDSHSFIPERWLGEPKTRDGVPLEHYLVAFGRGPRSCLGTNIAYAEMYLALGTIFRRFKFELYETDVTDVQLEHDWFIPIPKLDSKGIRLLVSKSED